MINKNELKGVNVKRSTWKKLHDLKQHGGITFDDIVVDLLNLREVAYNTKFDDFVKPYINRIKRDLNTENEFNVGEILTARISTTNLDDHY